MNRVRIWNWFFWAKKLIINWSNIPKKIDKNSKKIEFFVCLKTGYIHEHGVVFHRYYYLYVTGKLPAYDRLVLHLINQRAIEPISKQCFYFEIPCSLCTPSTCTLYTIDLNKKLDRCLQQLKLTTVSVTLCNNLPGLSLWVLAKH